jgi:predicted porin
LWLRVAPPVELTAQATYNRSVREMASQRYAVRIVPGATFDISAGYESYTYKGLFQSTLNPAFVFPSVDNNDKVRTIFGIVDWAFVPGWTLEVAAKNLRHDKSDPGDANRGEVGLRYSYNGKKDTAGLSAAFVNADRDENEYQEYRGFATYSPAKLRLALDAMTQQYKKEINGKKNQYQVVATAGYQLLAALQLSGNLAYTQSSNFQEDLAGLIRMTYDFAMSTGGKK